MHLPLFIGRPIDVIVELCYRGYYSCKRLPPYQEFSYSSLATLMLANVMVSLDSQNHTEVTLVFLLYGLTFSELDLMHEEEEIKIWIPLRPLKVSGISRVSYLYF
jgi:hypothetical protein